MSKQDRAKKLRKKGLTLKQIGKKLNLHFTTVWALLNKKAKPAKKIKKAKPDKKVKRQIMTTGWGLSNESFINFVHDLGKFLSNY